MYVVCMHVCVYLCMYVCVCLYVCIYVCICTDCGWPYDLTKSGILRSDTRAYVYVYMECMYE